RLRGKTAKFAVPPRFRYGFWLPRLWSYADWQGAPYVLPPQMREALSPHLFPLLAGLEEPDFFRVVSQKIPIISLRGTPPRTRALFWDRDIKRVTESAKPRYVCSFCQER